MVMPFEGIERFYERINEETENLSKKQAAKVFEKCNVKPSQLRKWNQSVSEAELAIKLDPEERVERLTFDYCVINNKEKSRKSATSASLSDTSTNNISLSYSNATPSTSKKVSKKPGGSKRNSSASNKKANNTRVDVYNFDEEDSDEAQPPGQLLLRKRCPKGEFQVYIRKHYDDESKSNPGLSKVEVTDILKKRWDSMTEDMRCVYVERKAIYEDESNMIVSKRANFDDDSFNDSEDEFYNDSDGGKGSENESEDKTTISNENSNSHSKPKRSRKSRKSEKLFDKIKNEPSLTDNGVSSTGTSRKRKSSASVKVQEGPSETPVRTLPTKSTSTTKPTPSTSTRKPIDSIKKEQKTPNVKNIKKEMPSMETTKKLCYEESGDDTNCSDAASVKSDAETSAKVKKQVDRFCYTCSDEETSTDGLVECDGACRRLFHKSCVKFVGSGSIFTCEECKTSKLL